MYTIPNNLTHRNKMELPKPEFHYTEEIWLDDNPDAICIETETIIPETVATTVAVPVRRSSTIWSILETQTFINLLISENVERVLERADQSQKVDIFESLEKKIHKLEVYRCSDQLQLKYEQFKELYRKAIRSGDHNIVFFKKIQQIFDYKIASSKPASQDNNMKLDAYQVSNSIDIQRRKKSSNWQNHEIKLFIELCLKKNINNLLSQKKYKHDQIFRSLESHMRRYGVHRDSMQLRIKYKKLRETYRKALANGVTCPYFKKLEKLFEDIKEKNKEPEEVNQIIVKNQLEENSSEFGIDSTQTIGGFNFHSLCFKIH